MDNTKGNFSTIQFLKNILYILLCLFSSNSFLLIKGTGSVVLAVSAVISFILVNILPFLFSNVHTARLKLCCHGKDCLITFSFACFVSVIYQIVQLVRLVPNHWADYLINLLICILSLSVIFWNGIICVYTTSIQLGIKYRVIGLLCGWIPIAHLFALYKIIRITSEEVRFEEEKYLLNERRKGEEICKTKYPVLLVHGVFFRDFKHLNYWGRIPDELTKNGATVYYGNHQSALSVKDSGFELANRINQIVRETGCQKVNIIAHSKGGLDIRYALAKCNISDKVASLTTINTPHRGCEFADYLLTKIPVAMQNRIAKTYNSALKKLGDTTPDFMASVVDLTANGVEKINQSLAPYEPPKGVYCQSVGSVLKHATGGKFPLNFSYHLVKHFDGENDGLVSTKSFPWSENFTLLKSPGKRGISHGDMIDLNRENISGFDVREFYVHLVNDLKSRGY
ncbi:MAG: triacylglycerol lipase [Ruminococcus sp.]|nr:triacylglycerol lipase [Ruminococcus sp.]